MTKSLAQGSFNVPDPRFGPGGNRLRGSKNEFKALGTNFVEKTNMFDITLEHGEQNSDQSVATTQVGNRFASNTISNTSKKLKTLQDFFEWQRPTLAQLPSKDG